MTTLRLKPTSLFITISLLSSIILICQPVSAQPTPPDPNQGLSKTSFNPSMGVVIIVLIAALFFMGFFSIYIRHCTEVNSSGTGVPTRRILAGSIARSRRAPRGLDPTVIEGFPTFDYAVVKTAKIGKGALECAVCLTEFEDDDTLRLIPHCDHVFHPECIDEWLSGHTTCPVCRANLTEPPTGRVVGLQDGVNQDHTVLQVADNENNTNTDTNNIDEEEESMEQPLHGKMKRNRSMMRNISIGRPRCMGKFSRSYSTGHVAVKQWENMDRFTLRLPNEVRRQIMSGKLERSTSLVVLPRESSTRRGYRTGIGFGEGTSRGRSDRIIGRSDQWVFSLTPPFISRVPSTKSPTGLAGTKIINRDGSVRGSIRQGSLRGSIRSGSTRLPV